MSEKCKYCDYVSKCSRFCEYNSIMCLMHRSFPKIVDKTYEELEKENQELKKQLHEASLQIQSLIEEDMTCPSNCDKLRRMKEQQKEFIEWLEKEIQRQENYAVSLGLTIDYGIAEYTSGKIDALKEILSKYKEIIGVKDE